MAYTISFDSLTSTEAVYDYIRILRNNSNSAWGAEKYSGGVNNTHSNWPGLQGRSVLVIPDSRFTVYFQTNNTINGWGFKMTVTPYYPNQDLSEVDSATSLSGVEEAEAAAKAAVASGQPMIFSRAKSYKDSKGRSVHDRLYQQGRDLMTEKHNKNVELMKEKLNLAMRPWEDKWDKHGFAHWTQEKSYLAKNQKTVEDYLFDGE